MYRPAQACRAIMAVSSLLPATLLLAQTTLFEADFEGSLLSTPPSANAELQTNLNSGTAIGSWTVSSAEESYITHPPSSSTKWIFAEFGPYDFKAHFSSAAVLTDGGVTVEFDFTFGRLGTDRDHIFTLLQADGTIGVQLTIRYFNGGDWTALGPGGTLIDLPNFPFDRISGQSSTLDTLRRLKIVLSEASYDVFIDDDLQAFDLAYANPVSNVATLTLEGTQEFSGGIYDDILVTQVLPSEVLAGAIRWDAWVGDGMTFGLTNQGSLSPAKWHTRIPFYSTVISENEVEIVATEQVIMDQEILYAADGGLDYFAFLLYNNFNLNGGGYALSQSLALYETSAFKDRLNFAVILPNPAHIKVEDWDRWIDRFVAYFSQPTYQTVLGNRPLVYAFRWFPWELAADMITDIEAACTVAGLPEPYFVDLYFNTSLHPSFDALSDYAISNNANPLGTFPYADLTSITETLWQTRANAGLKIIPNATAGWNAQPRVEYPGDWDLATHPWYNDRYDIPTPTQLADHVQAAVDFVEMNPVACEANAILIYSWNEFGEGGWLCPGLPAYEGSARLQALAPVLKGGFMNSETSSGTPKSWLDDYFVTDNYEYVDLRDTDGDGWITSLEYHVGTDPTDPSSFFYAWLEWPSVNEDPAIRVDGVADRTYTVWYSENMDTWEILKTVTTVSDGVLEVTDPDAGMGRFYRVSVLP